MLFFFVVQKILFPKPTFYRCKVLCQGQVLRAHEVRFSETTVRPHWKISKWICLVLSPRLSLVQNIKTQKKPFASCTLDGIKAIRLLHFGWDVAVTG